MFSYSHVVLSCTLSSALMEYVRKGNETLPEIDSHIDKDAPKRKLRKFVGEEFIDFEKQIARKAYRVQKWWNIPMCRRSVYKRREAFPAFGNLVTHLALIQSSSACSERVFSILEHNFGDKQNQSLQDLKEATCQFIYNNRKS